MHHSEQKRGFFLPGLFTFLLMLFCLGFGPALLSSCASSNPIAAAQTSAQRAYALYGTFVVFEEQGAQLVENPAVPASFKAAIRKADAVAYPAANALLTAINAYEAAKTAVASGAMTASQEQATANALAVAVSIAANDVQGLVSAVKSSTVPATAAATGTKT